MPVDLFRNKNINIHTLILPISTLNLLMHILLHLALKYPGARGLVKVSDFENVRRVDPVVCPSAHHMVALDVEFVYGDLPSDKNG